jgi:hypothetical protein
MCPPACGRRRDHNIRQGRKKARVTVPSATVATVSRVFLLARLDAGAGAALPR